VRRPTNRRSTVRPLALALGAALLLAAACGERGTTTSTTPNGSRLELPAGVQPVDFAPGTVEIHTASGATHTLHVEIAENDAQRERGLMFRTAMPAEAGMIFIYPEQQPDGAFWMYNTRIPLSIAYADSAGVIATILEMEPCRSEYQTLCPNYPAGAPFQYALEANQGYFMEHGVRPGDRIVIRK
jgi:uncharacterized membrane protein (UPF0127 family)